MSFNFSNTFKDLKSIGDKFTSGINNDILPYAQRTTRQFQEKFGKIDDISQLPEEYTQLAAQCNNYSKFYENLLKITSIYESENYDYPLNLNLTDSITDFSKIVTSKVSDLSKATSTSEAQSALLSPSNIAKQPKTLYHTLSFATNPALITTPSNQEDPLIKSLSLYSSNLNSIANARLGQDQLITQHFNKPIRKTLRTLFHQSHKIQKQVEQKRIDYDLARYNLSHARPEKEAQLRVVLENCEDEFANVVEDAVNIMKNVLLQGSQIKELKELIKAQLAYHQLAAELLGSVVDEVETFGEEPASTTHEFDI